MAHRVLQSPDMPIRSILATFAIVSLSACAHPRAALVTGTMVAVVGGALVATTHVRDCSSPEASELCGFDQGSDNIKQGTGAVILVSGLVLVFAGLVGLSNEHNKHPAVTAPTAPTASSALISRAAEVHAIALGPRIGRDAAVPRSFEPHSVAE